MACNAFAGANDPAVGPIRGQSAQKDMPSMDECARLYGGVSLDDERLVFVHLLLYGFGSRAPTAAEARSWAEHFGLDERANHVVLVGDPRMVGPKTYRMIPGLQLVDRDFVLRYDSAGARPPHDLWKELWPGVKGVLAGS
jgi:hypothetical protein